MQPLSLWCCSSKTPWIPYAERDQRDLADHRAHVLYKVCGRTLTKHLGKMQKCRILHI